MNFNRKYYLILSALFFFSCENTAEVNQQDLTVQPEIKIPEVIKNKLSKLIDYLKNSDEDKFYECLGQLKGHETEVKAELAKYPRGTFNYGILLNANSIMKIVDENNKNLFKTTAEDYLVKKVTLLYKNEMLCYANSVYFLIFGTDFLDNSLLDILDLDNIKSGIKLTNEEKIYIKTLRVLVYESRKKETTNVKVKAFREKHFQAIVDAYPTYLKTTKDFYSEAMSKYKHLEFVMYHFFEMLVGIPDFIEKNEIPGIKKLYIEGKKQFTFLQNGVPCWLKHDDEFLSIFVYFSSDNIKINIKEFEGDKLKALELETSGNKEKEIVKLNNNYELIAFVERDKTYSHQFSHIKYKGEWYSYDSMNETSFIKNISGERRVAVMVYKLVK